MSSWGPAQQIWKETVHCHLIQKSKSSPPRFGRAAGSQSCVETSATNCKIPKSQNPFKLFLCSKAGLPMLLQSGEENQNASAKPGKFLNEEKMTQDNTDTVNIKCMCHVSETCLIPVPVCPLHSYVFRTALQLLDATCCQELASAHALMQLFQASQHLIMHGLAFK